MVDSVANILLETLRDVLTEEVKFLSGVSDEVKKVERDLRTIHGLLMEADRERSDSLTLKDCIAELKELAFKAENVLETYAVEVKSKKEGRSLKKKLQRFIGILCECYSVHQTGNEIDDIRSRLADLTGKLSSSISRSSKGASNSISTHKEQQHLLRLRYEREVEQHFVGMEKDIERLVSMVLKDDDPSLISICGMGGLGKTTLARKIYNHQHVRGRFDGRAWVCVTQQFQAQTILRDILKQVDNCRGDEIDTMGLPELVRGLHSVLEQKKCLFVIDDIWESCHWDILKPAFPMNCKVVLTTRKKNIVTYEECSVYELDFLSEDEGWELLGKIALPTNVDDATEAAAGLINRSKSFEKMGRQMVKKCGRLPLAISVIGGILRRQKQILGEWEKVSSNIDSYLKRGEGIGNDTGVKLILDLSYDVLPYYLKPCFLYLACFPEDQEIYKEQLYLLWMGEGLISLEEKGNNESLGDVAERYLTELVFRCMIQVEKGPNNKFESCRLHDLMRDLCSSKAKEEKFMKRIDISKHQHDSGVSNSIQRVAINLDDDRDAISLCKSCAPELKGLRSFLVLWKNSDSTRSYYVENIVNLENSKHLRVLVLDRLEFEGGNLPSTICELIHLRYLSLRHCNVAELPQHVCHLPYLHSLDLWMVNDCLKLPNLIWKMKRLRHLRLPRKIQVIGGDKLRLDGLNELETLEHINSKTACIGDIINLINLRKLNATIEDDMDSLSKIADYMSNNGCQLRETRLIIRSCDLSSQNVVKKMLMSPSLVSLRMDCEIGSGFPCYEQGMCHNLVNLGIYDSKNEGDIGIDVDVVEELGKYPNLQYLSFKGKEQMMNTEMRFGVNSFPELKYLYMGEMLNLKKWEVEKGAMPKLEDLVMYDCSNLETLPDGLRFIPTLRRLQCNGMSSELKGRMRRGKENGEGEGQDYANFSHIPHLDIS